MGILDSNNTGVSTEEDSSISGEVSSKSRGKASKTGSSSWRAVARKYGISWAVLYPRLKGKIAIDASLGAKSTLSKELETKILNHCIEMANKGRGLDWVDV